MVPILLLNEMKEDGSGVEHTRTGGSLPYRSLLWLLRKVVNILK
jgi:hypothetical protein